jgi:hypothetical protein
MGVLAIALLRFDKKIKATRIKQREKESIWKGINHPSCEGNNGITKLEKS